MRNSVKEIFGLQKSRLWFVLAALLISSLTFAQAQNNVLFVKSGVTDGDPIAVGGVSGTVYNTPRQAVEHAQFGDTVRLTEDVTAESYTYYADGAAAENPRKCCVVCDRIVIDGAGHFLTPADEGATSAIIYTHGGTIMNLTIKGRTPRQSGLKGIIAEEYSGTVRLYADLILDNVTFENVDYTLNVQGEVNNNNSVIIRNSHLNGQTSYANLLKSYTVINSEFGQGYEDKTRFKPYGAAIVQECTFTDCPVNLSSCNGNAVLFNGCTINITPLSSDNLDNLLETGVDNKPKAVVTNSGYSANSDGEITSGIYGGSLTSLNSLCAEGYKGFPLGTDPETYRVTPVYYIHYNNNGGSGTMDDSYVPREAPNNVFTVPACTFTHASFSFLKWNTQAYGNGTDLAENDPMTLTSDTTLYAVWDCEAMIGTTCYGTLTEAIAAAAIGDTVKMLKDVVVAPQNISGITENLENCCIVVDRIVLDGQGHSLHPASSVNEIIYTKGGTIMNLVLNGYAFKGIYAWGYNPPANMNADLILDNVTMNNVIYTFHIDGDRPQNVSVTIKNSSINGWTSYSPVFNSYTVIDSEFGESYGYAVFRPYGQVVVSRTSFSAGYQLDPTISPSILLNDCNLAGTPLTSDNIDNILVNLATDQPVPQEDPSSHAVVVDGDYSANDDGEITGGIYGGNLDVLNSMIASGHAAFPLNTDPQTYQVDPAYFIHFNSNGGTGGTMDDSYVPREAPNNVFTVPACGFTYDDFAFLSWNTQADGNGTSYSPGNNITLTSDITLYAQWRVEARIGTTKYSTLAEAITAATAGDQVVLLKNVTLTASQTIDKSITLDLDGHTISGNISKLINITDGDVSITNGSIVNSNSNTIEHAGTGTLTLTDCELYGITRVVHIGAGGTVNATTTLISSTGTSGKAVEKTDGVFSATRCKIMSNLLAIDQTSGTLYLENDTIIGGNQGISNNNGTVKINGGVVKSKTYSNSASMGTIVNLNGVVDIYGNVQIQSYYRAIVQGITSGNAGVVNLGGYQDGSDFVAVGAPSIVLRDTTAAPSSPYAIGVSHEGTINIFGDATVTANSPLVTAAINLNKGGTANITGGTIETSNKGILLAEWTYPSGSKNTLNISESAFIRTTGTGGVCVYDAYTYPSDIDIWGGTFSEDVSGEMCRDGYAAVANGTDPETYTVVPVYTVYYDANLTPNQRDTVYVRRANPTHTVQANTFTTDDFIFTTWNTKADGTGTNIAVGATMNITRDTTLYAQWQDVVAKIGTNKYTSLQAAIDDATAGDSIVVMKDLTVNATVVVNKSITINGLKHTIDATNAVIGSTKMALAIDEINLDVKIRNLNINGGNTCQRGVQVSGEGYADNCTVVIDSCRIYNFTHYAITTKPNSNGSKFTVSNSYIQGWTALSSYGGHSTFNFYNDTLRGINRQSGGNNDLNVITLNGQSTSSYGIQQANKVDIQKCVIIAEELSTSKEFWLGFSYGAKNDTVTVDCLTKIVDGTGSEAQNVAGKIYMYEEWEYDEVITGNVITVALTSEQKEALSEIYTLNDVTGDCDRTRITLATQYTKNNGENTMYVGFNYPFNNGLAANDKIELLEDVNMTQDVTADINGNFKLNFKEGSVTHSITNNDHHIILAEGTTCTTDQQALSLFSSPSGHVTETNNGNGTYTYGMANVYNATLNVYYYGLQVAIDAANAGDSLVVLADMNIVETGDAGRIKVNKSIVINGEKHLVTTKATRGLGLENGSNLDVTLRNFYMTCNNVTNQGSDAIRGVQIYNTSAGSHLLLDSCRIVVSGISDRGYALNFPGGADNVTVIVKNSYIQGWAALNCYSRNSTFIFDNDTLYGLNTQSTSDWDNFNTISIDGNNSNMGSNNNVSISKSVIIAEQRGTCIEWVFSCQNKATSNTIVVDCETKIVNGKGTDAQDVRDKLLINNQNCPYNSYTLPLTEEQKTALASDAAGRRFGLTTIGDEACGTMTMTKVSRSARNGRCAQDIGFHLYFDTENYANHVIAGGSAKLTLIEDVVLQKDETVDVNGRFLLFFKDWYNSEITHSITNNGHHIILAEGTSCGTDVEVPDSIFAVPSGFDGEIVHKSVSGQVHKFEYYAAPYVAINVNRDIKYTSLQTAADSVNTGDTVRLLRNITFNNNNDRVIITDKNLTLDLYGDTITYNVSNANYAAIQLKSGNLEVKDTKGEGVIRATIKGSAVLIGTSTSSGGNASFTLKSGKLEGTAASNTWGLYVVLNDADSVVINGGEVSATGNGPALYNKQGKVVVNGGRIQGNGRAVYNYYAYNNTYFPTTILNGGEINGGNGTYACVDNDGGTFTMNGGTLNITGTKGISSKTNYYGGTGDLYINGGVINNEGTASTTIYLTNGEAHVSGGTFTATDANTTIFNGVGTGAVFTISDVTASGAAMFNMATGSTCTVNSGSFNATDKMFANAGTITLNGGVFTQTSTNDITNTGTFTVNEGWYSESLTRLTRSTPRWLNGDNISYHDLADLHLIQVDAAEVAAAGLSGNYWELGSFITYHSNDGNNLARYQSKPNEVTVTLFESVIFARPGYYVTNWNTQPDGSGDTYEPGTEFSVAVAEDVHLYAMWTANSDPSLTQYVPGSHAGFVVAGNGDFTAGQLFAIPAVVAAASSAPGVQQGYVVITDYTADRCEGYAFSEYGFDIAADAPARDTLLTHYDPEVRNFYGYDSITNLAVTAHLTQYVTDTTIYLADYVHPDFGTEYGDQTVTYHSEAFGCDSVVTMRVYRLGSILNDTVVAIPGHSEMEVTMTTLPEILPNDFFEAGGTLTPAQVAPYTDNYPTGATTPVVWVATIADSSATFTNYVTVLEPVCDTMHPVDGSGNTYDVVRLIHNCWLKQNLRTELYADGEPVPHVYHYPGADPVIYGYLYTYDDATGHYPPATRSSTILQGVCPNGWHIPTYDDVTELMAYYDTEDLMSQTNWVNPGNNSSEFTMQPAGYYNPASYAPYQMLHVLAYFWTYTPGSSVYHACEFGSMCGTIELLPSSGEMGYSVRCVKN